MATSIRHRLEQAEALVAEKEAAYEKEMASMKRELQKTKKEAHKANAEPEKWREPKRLAELKGKKPFLQMKLQALENAHAEVVAAQTRLRDVLNEDIRGYYERMHGLLSYESPQPQIKIEP